MSETIPDEICHNHYIAAGSEQAYIFTEYV